MVARWGGVKGMGSGFKYPLEQISPEKVAQWAPDYTISLLHNKGGACGQFCTYSAQLLLLDSLPTPELACVHFTEPQIGH